MKFIIALLLCCLYLTGCKTVDNSKEIKESVVSSYYNEYTKTYEWDQWDYYINAIKSGKVIFEWPTAIFIYLVSNVKFFDAYPGNKDIDWYEHIGVTVVIFRWSW